jgi:DNA-directed RNA polymerase specialized sigma24 family protein
MNRRDRREEPLRAEPEAEARLTLPRKRSLAEQVVARAYLLNSTDRAFLLAAFDDGRSAADLGRLTGVSPRSVRRRLRRLADRVLSSRFLFVGKAMHRWPPTRRRVAEAVVLRGLSMRQAAQEMKISVYVVRAHMNAINAMFSGAMAA